MALPEVLPFGGNLHPLLEDLALVVEKVVRIPLKLKELYYETGFNYWG